MKKWWIAVLLGCGCMAFAAGCGSGDQPPQNPVDQLQSQMDPSPGTSLPQVGNLPGGNPDVVRSEVVMPSSSTPADQPTAVQGQQTAGITLEQAKQIALQHAKLSDATFVKTGVDMDHGVQKYEIEFYAGNTEYDYEIDASTGAILSFDSDIEHYTPPQGNTGAASGDIGSARAQEIALQHAKLDASNVVGLRVKKDYDDGVSVYEVEFYYNNVEYQYEIHAANGSVLSYEQDHD